MIGYIVLAWLCIGLLMNLADFILFHLQPHEPTDGSKIAHILLGVIGYTIATILWPIYIVQTINRWIIYSQNQTKRR